MSDSSQQPGPRAGWLWPVLAALLFAGQVVLPAGLQRSLVGTFGGLALLFGTLPLWLALADHGLRLALRASEHARLTPRLGDRAAAVARWTELAGPLQLAVGVCTGSWLLAQAWPTVPWLPLPALALYLLAGELLVLRGGEVAAAPLQAAAAFWGPLLRPLLAHARSLSGQPAVHEAANAALAEAIEVSDQEGELSVDEADLLRRELDFVTARVDEIMVPWSRVEWLRADASLAENLRRLAASSHSRQPLCDAQGHVVGTMVVKDLLPLLGGDGVSAMPRPRPTPRLAPDAALDTALQALRSARASLAVVEDETGTPLGLVALEDLIEELVGEIVDETDAGVVRETLRLDGRRPLTELSRRGVRLPAAPADQGVADFLREVLGTQEPAVGATWRRGTLSLTVATLDADGQIDEVDVAWRLSDTGSAL